jgi:hypothetical protein
MPPARRRSDATQPSDVLQSRCELRTLSWNATEHDADAVATITAGTIHLLCTSSDAGVADLLHENRPARCAEDATRHHDETAPGSELTRFARVIRWHSRCTATWVGTGIDLVPRSQPNLEEVMKTAVRRKLELKTETVVMLQDAALEEIHGGTSPAGPILFTASVRFCAPVSAAILRSAERSCVTCRC